MIEIDVNEVMQKFDDLIGSLTYVNYCYNRRRSPHITPEQWKKVYGARTKEMEMLYQLDKEG